MLQALVNAAALAGPLVLLAIGLWMVFATSRVFHIFHAALFVLCPYLVFLLMQQIQVASWAAVCIALAVVGLVGFAVGRFLMVASNRFKATGLMLFLSSLGLAVVMQNVIALAFGNQSMSLRISLSALYRVSPFLVVAESQTVALVCSGFTILLIAAWVTWTLNGKQVRAMSENRFLAVAIGLPTARLTSAAFVAGAALSGLSGLLIANSNGINPAMGIGPFFIGIAIMLLAYEFGIVGIVLVGIVVAFSQELLLWYLPGHWGQAALYGVVVLFLAVRSTRHSPGKQRLD